MNIQDLFLIKFWFEDNGIPKYSIKLKEEYKIKKPYPMNKNNFPVSPSSRDYFEHFVGNELAEEAYCFFKKFFNKKFAFEYGFLNNLLDQKHKKVIDEYFDQVNIKMIKNHKTAIDKPEYHEKLRKAADREANSKRAKKWYSNPANKAKMLENSRNPILILKKVAKYKDWLENRGGKKILSEACNKESRKQKISASSKKMWSDARLNNDFEKLEKWFENRKYKKRFKLLDKKVNRIEYALGKILIDYKIDFQYEPLLVIEEKHFYPDFLLIDKVIIECYGDFWHANPIKYKSEDLIFHDFKANDIWNKDKSRISQLEKAGYKVFYFWESDLLKNTKEISRQISIIAGQINKNV